MSTIPAKAADPRQIALVSQARMALAEARSIDEVKDIRDKAEAMRLYLKQRNESLEAQNAAAEIKLWAERRAGEMLVAMEESGDRNGRGGDRKTKSNDSTLIESPRSLSDLGISKDESSRFQAVADIPEPLFEEHIEQTKAAEKPLTTNGVLKQARELKEEAEAVFTPPAPREALPRTPRPADNPLHVALQRVLMTVGCVEAAPGMHSHGWGGLEPYVRGLSATERGCIRAQIEHVRDRFQEWIDIIDRIEKE